MKKIIIILFSHICVILNATNYYVSTTGNQRDISQQLELVVVLLDHMEQQEKVDMKVIQEFIKLMHQKLI